MYTGKYLPRFIFCLITIVVSWTIKYDFFLNCVNKRSFFLTVSGRIQEGATLYASVDGRRKKTLDKVLIETILFIHRV